MSTIDTKIAGQLQRAAELIKSGDKQNAQKILADVLNADPRNEQAWLWMATVVSDDRRRYCLEKAVSINPNNAHARQALARMTQSEAPPPTSSALPRMTNPPAVVTPGPAAAVSETSTPVSPSALGPAVDKVWMKPRKYYVDVSVLSGDELVVGRVSLGRSREIQERMREGRPLVDLLDNKENVPLKDVTKATLSLGLLYVTYRKSKDDQSTVYVPCADEDTAKAALDTLQERLGPEFERTQAPIRTCMALGIPATIMVAVMAGTGLFYWLAQQAVAADHISGSARARGMAVLLRLVGPNGVLCIGGVLLLLAIILLVRWGLNPPLETVLSRQGAAAA